MAADFLFSARNMAEFSQLRLRIALLEYEAKEKSSGVNINVEGSRARLAAGWPVRRSKSLELLKLELSRTGQPAASFVLPSPRRHVSYN